MNPPRYALSNLSLVALSLFAGLGLCATLTWAMTWQRPTAPQGVALLSTATPAPRETPRAVRLLLDGTPQALMSAYDYPGDILRQAGIALGALDRVWLDGQPAEPQQVALWALPVDEIAIERAVTVTIDDEGQRLDWTTSADSVGAALTEAQLELYASDEVSPPLDAPLSAGLLIRIQRAAPISIRVDGQTLPTRAQAATVGEALAQAGISLQGLDYVLPPESDPVSAGMTIQVVRVTESLEGTESLIPYETVYQADSSLPLDTRQVVQGGQEGVLRETVRVRYADGVEISREPMGEEVIRAPQNEVVAYGTQIVLYELQTPEGTLQYWRKLRVYATSYHPAALGGDDVTAIGERLRKGIIGANPRIIPYRTQVYVPGYGQGMIADTGGPRSSPYWIDLGYSDADFVGWHRYVDIYLLAPPPANLNLLLPDWRPMRGLPDNGG